MTKSTLSSSEDFIGAAVTWDANALDGLDADFAGQLPEYDASGRYMPYWTRAADGGVHVDPIVFDPAPGANDWYDIPKKFGKVFFTEPYIYPIEGKDVLMASLFAPIVIEGQFQGTASADFTLTQLRRILSDLKVMEGGELALISNGGLYASHSNMALINKKVDDLPAAGLAAVRQGLPFEYRDAQDVNHFLQPVRIHPDTQAWSVRMSFAHSVAMASARQPTLYTLIVAVVCALATALILVMVVSRLMKPLRALSQAMTQLSSGDPGARQCRQCGHCQCRDRPGQ